MIGFLDVLVLGLGEAAVVALHVLLEEVVEHLLPAHLAPAHRHVTRGNKNNVNNNPQDPHLPRTLLCH